MTFSSRCNYPLVKFNRSDASKMSGTVPPPKGNTPLGEVINEAYNELPASQDNHIFIITDGEQNGNMDMNRVVKDNKIKAKSYFVAFDVSAKTFSKVKEEGSLVTSANNKNELLTVTQNIFSTKILLEKEE